jgi:hypothetical protein
VTYKRASSVSPLFIEKKGLRNRAAPLFIGRLPIL